MKKIPIIIFLLIISIFLYLQLPFVAYAEVISGNCGSETGIGGDNLKWTLDTTTGLLSITGSGRMKNWSNSDEVPWAEYRGSIHQVSLPDSMKNIGDYAFCDCLNINSILIPEGVQSIGKNSFSNCLNLQEASLPDSLLTIDSNAFLNCALLPQICIPINTRNIRSFAFKGCTSLLEVNVEEGNTSFMSDNGVLFNKDMTTIILYPAAKSGSYTLPSGVTEICVGAFYGCKDLDYLELPDSTLIIDSFSFYGCTAIESIELPNGLLEIGGSSFSGCVNLSSIIIPDSVKTIGDYAFRNCSSLSLVSLGSGIEEIGQKVFSGCNIIELYVDVNSIQTWFWMTPSIESLALGENVEKIGDYAFYKCSGISSVIIPYGVKSIGKEAFSQCSNIRYVSIPSSVNTIGVAPFSECYEIKKIQIGVSEIQGWFSYRSLIESVIFTAGVSVIADEAFRNCSGLTHVIIPSTVTTIGDKAFTNCSSLSDIYYEDTTSNWNEIDISQNAIPYYTRIHYCVEDPDSHWHIIEEVLPTCETNGRRLLACPCGYSYSEIIPMNSHNWIITTTVAPTCGEDGYDIETCSFCGKSRKTNINTDRPNHEWNSETIAPTCTTSGYECLICIKCGISEYSNFTDALGHNWGEPTYDWDINYNYVTGTRICERDTNHTESETVSTSYIVTKEATYDEEGEIVYSAFFSNSAFTDQTKTVIIPRLQRENPFTDVPENKYFYEPVLWAYYHDPQITAGTSDTTFGPNETCTRVQIVTFLWKTFNAPEPKGTTSPFTDVPVGKWFFKPVLWAVEQGITSGVGNGKFGVNENCTRAQAVTFIWIAAGRPEPVSTVNPFSDVKEGKWYYKAVLWAVEQNITGGVGGGKFGVDDTCTRAQIVTFLYKAFG